MYLIRLVIVSLFLLFGTMIHAQAEGFVSFDGNEIAYSDEGAGFPVLLLHGFLNKGENWRGSVLYRSLLDAGYRVIVPDLRGNGKSVRKFEEQIYRDNAEVKDLIALADHLEIRKYYAVGYSRGSIVLGELIVSDKRIKKAVFGGMGIDFTDANWLVPSAFAAAFLEEEPLNELTSGAVKYARTIDVDLKVMGWLQRYQPSTSPQRLKKYKCPVLIIKGDKDDSNGAAAPLAEIFKRGRLKYVPGDHNTTYRKASLAREVMLFLSEGK